MNRLLLLSILLYSFTSFGQLATVFQAEHEKNEGVLMVWDYTPARDSITANVAAAVQNTAKVWIIYYPGLAPQDTTEIRQFLLNQGCGYQNVHFLDAWTETLWIRDFGPFTGYGDFGEGMERYMLDAGYSAYDRPKDDSIPSQIAHHWEMPVVELPMELEGGNILLDGLKYGFASDRILDQNPAMSEQEVKEMLEAYFNMDEFILLEALPNSGGGIWGHVDMYIKIVDAETIMVSKYPVDAPDYDLIESQVEYLSQLNNYFGEPFNIIRIPVPPNADGSYPTQQDDEMRTYTNSLTINNVVVVPSYNLPYHDSVAKEIYQEAMPGYDIQMVDARNITPLYGAIHCITKEVPQEEMLRIIHQKKTGEQPYYEEMLIFTECQFEFPVDSILLYYRKNDEAHYTKTEIYQTCPQNYGVIPDVNPQDTIHYYIEAKTATASTKYPLSAPEGNFTFWFSPTVETQDIANESISISPNPVTHTFQIQSSFHESGELEIISLQGKVIWKQQVSTHEPITIPDHITPGIYVISFLGQTGTQYTTKFIKK